MNMVKIDLQNREGWKLFSLSKNSSQEQGVENSLMHGKETILFQKKGERYKLLLKVVVLWMGVEWLKTMKLGMKILVSVH